MGIVIDFPVSQCRQLCKIGTRGRRHPPRTWAAGDFGREARMDVQINRESGVPLRLQLGRQIALLIATGKLEPGCSLPSVRALATRLKIHYNTVSRVYQDLVDSHLVEKRRNRRLIVPLPGTRTGKGVATDLDDVINAAIQMAQDNGYTLQQLRQRVQQRLLAQPPDHVLVVVNEPGFRKLLQVELEQRLECHVASCSLSDLSSNRELAIGALVVGAPGNMPEISHLMPKDRAPFPITYSTAEQHVALVRKLREPSVIAVVSVSELFLQTARGLLAPALGGRHTLREYLLPSDKPGNLGVFSLVFCDSIARSKVKAKNLVHYRLVSSESLVRLAKAMKS